MKTVHWLTTCNRRRVPGDRNYKSVLYQVAKCDKALEFTKDQGQCSTSIERVTCRKCLMIVHKEFRKKVDKIEIRLELLPL